MSKSGIDNQCRLCGSKNYRTLLKGIKTAYDEEYALVQCACGFISISPMPDEKTLKKYYDQDYWDSGENASKSGINKLFEIRMRPALRRLKKHLPNGGRVLDWGAGDGQWVRMMADAGFESIGIDQYSVNPDNENFINGGIEARELSNRQFDAITCFHVLEHLRDPIKSIENALGKLRKHGIMIIEVPNIYSSWFTIFKKRWQPLEVPTHLNHFNPETLGKIILDNRADIITKEFFSLRASPSVPVLSVFPGLTPKLVRRLHQGRYPLPLKLLYLLLQMMACPLCMITAMLKRGSIMRITLIKK